MKYGSVCSGIEAATMAWHPLGWSPAFFSEIEKFPSAVLEHHYGSNMPGEAPATNGVPNYGDMTKFKEWPDHDIDILVGGTPCQSFSIAGLRAGLEDPRGNLMLTYVALAKRYQPQWLVWENVPGVLSSNGGRDFGTFLRALAECGYGFAYRVLDAQYVRVDGFERAVPQRRRRVFVVGYLGDWRRAAAVLFEPEGLRGDPAPRREARKATAADVAPSLVSSGRGVERAGDTRGQDPVVAELITNSGDASYCVSVNGQRSNDAETETLVAQAIAPAINASNPYGDHESREGLLVAHALRGEGFDASEDGTGRGTPLVPVAFSSKDFGADAMEDCSPTLRSGGHSESHANAGVPPGVAYALGSHAGAADGEQTNASHDSGGPVGLGVQEQLAYSLRAGRTQAVATEWAVRRLTPTECERLQGFPDGYTNIPWRGKETAPDGPRYKALGNSFAINVVRWIGQRIQAVEDMGNEDVE